VGAPIFNPSSLNGIINTIFDGIIMIESIIGENSLGGVRSTFNSIINTVYGLGYVGAAYNITIKAKSVCGFEPWSGTVLQDPDRKDDRCEGEASEEMQECMDAMQAQQSTIDQLSNTQSNLCDIANQKKDIYVTESNQWATAFTAWDNCRTTALGNGQDPNVVCATQKATEQTERTERDIAHGEAETASDNCDDAGQDVEDASDYSNIPECQGVINF
jgi:hypothetical protein